MSNAGQQTRGLSAGDWTRMKRLRGARTSGYTYTGGESTYAGDLTSNKDINPTNPSQHRYNAALMIPYDGAGKSRILRPASKWTDFVAAGRADYVTQSRRITDNSTSLSTTRICSCIIGTSVVIPVPSGSGSLSASIDVGGFTEFRFTFPAGNATFPANPSFFMIIPDQNVPTTIQSGSTAVMIGNGNVTSRWSSELTGAPATQRWRFGNGGAPIGSISYDVPAGGTFLTLTFPTAPFPPGTSVRFSYFSS